ncbi:MAG: inositol monophosphatase family protein [Mariprofundales bacterium]|nr:inositol monophosphatase family protein [Mariprofundales bacterium]
MLYVAIRAARKAGDMIARAFDKRDRLKITRKEEHDYVTNVDQHAESIILSELQQHYPDHGYVAEESDRVNQNASIVWYIDPLDGTTNFIHGYPHFAVSIGAWRYGKPYLAVVHDPILNETFEAQAGKGAFLNRQRLRVAEERNISNSIFASGLPPYRLDQVDQFQKRMDHCMRSVEGYRRGGSAALDMAYIASGRLDAYWEGGLKPWDLAAGVLLVQEAGGMVTNLEGAKFDIEAGDVLAANRDLHGQFLHLLTAADRLSNP